MKTDSQIQNDVLQNLKWDPSVTHEHIGVSVSNGIVTLSGTVPNFAEKYSASTAAQKVSGVKAIVEKIDVKLPGTFERDDQDIAEAITDQFSWNVQVPEAKIKVEVEKGWVTLRGDVDWEFQREAAERCVRGLTGVKGISNLIQIKTKSVRSDEIRKKIEDALKRETEREVEKISVAVQGSKVILSGEVRSLSEKEDARWAAWSAPGVTLVENNLSIGGM